MRVISSYLQDAVAQIGDTVSGYEKRFVILFNRFCREHDGAPMRVRALQLANVAAIRQKKLNLTRRDYRCALGHCV